MWKIPLATVKDNGPDSLIEQHVTIKQPGMFYHRDNSQWCIIKCHSAPCVGLTVYFARNTLIDQISLKICCRRSFLLIPVLKETKGFSLNTFILQYKTIQCKQLAMADIFQC